MNAREPFSDATLELMLRRRAARAEPGELRETVLAAIEAIEPRRSLWPARWHPSSLTSTNRSWPLLVAATLLLLALLAGALAAGAAWLRQHQAPSIELTPTGIELMTPGDLTWAEVVEDGGGTVWALTPGEVTRFDPESGSHRTWTISDDAGFDTWAMAPAHSGGVWLWAGDAILRFAGERFAEAIPAPGSTGILDEAADGTLWASPGNESLVRWDGSRWVAQSTDGLPPDQQILALLANSRDDVWIGISDQFDDVGARSYVAHLAGDRWSISDSIVSGGSLGSLVEGIDGSLWIPVPDGTGVEHFDTRRWSYTTGPADWSVGELSVDHDGALWTTLHRWSDAEHRVGRYASGTWTIYGPDDGLPDSMLGSVSATGAGVFAGTDSGLMRYARGSWTSMWTRATAPTEAISLGGSLVAVSRDDAWFADASGIWHYLDGVWEGPIQPPGLAGAQATGIALADDGSLWAATDAGVAVRSDGRWATAFDQKVLSIDLAADGSAWVGDFPRITHLIPTPTGFRSEEVACPMPAITLTVASDDTVWVGGLSYSGKAGLAHFDGTTCDEVDLRSDPSANTTVEVSSIVAEPSGGVLVHAIEGEYEPSTGEYRQPPTESVIRLSAGTRTVVASSTGTYPSSFGALAIAPDGQLWWARDRGATGEADSGTAPGPGIARFDGERWIQVLSGVDARGPIVVTRDGTVWFQGAAGIMRIQAAAAPAP